MTCPDAEDLIAAMERPAGDPRRAELDRHAAGCSRCREVAREHERVSRSLPLVITGARSIGEGSCPEPQALLDLATGRAAGEPAERLHAHLADCARCAGSAAEIAHWLEAGLPQGDELLAEAVVAAGELPRQRWPRAVTARPAAPRAWRWAAGLALAASLGGLAVLARFGLPARTGPGGEPAPVRAATPAVAGMPLLLSPREGERLGQPGLEVRWQAVAGASSYTVTVLDGRGGMVWEGSTTATSLRLPEGVVLAPGASHFAWVTAQLGDGRSVASPAVAFTAFGPGR